MTKAKKFEVVIDSREKLPWIFEEDERCAGCYIQKLEAGDYSLAGFEDYFAIERKRNTNEIATNILESRWPAFLEKFSKVEKGFMIMEFSVDDILRYPLGSSIPKNRMKYIKTSPQLILSKIADMQVNYGINIIFAGSTDNARLMSYNIMKKIFSNGI